MSDSPLIKYSKSLVKIYSDCCRQATSGLIRNYVILAGSVIAYIIFIISINIFGQMGFAGGMILGLIHIALVSAYYSWISDTTSRDKLNFKQLWQLDYGMFSTVMSVAFVLWIARFIIQSLIQGLNEAWLLDLMDLAIFLIFNAIPEVIYIQKMESVPALKSAANFTQRFWIEWYLPLLVILSPWLLYSALYALLVLSDSQVLLPSLTVITSLSALGKIYSWLPGWLLIALGLVLANWYMLFRAQLFQALESNKYRLTR